MGLFKKKTADPDQLSALRADLVSLRLRIDDADRIKAELLEKVESVDQTTSDLNSRVESINASTDELGDRVGSVSVEVGKMRNGVADVNHQINTVNAQVSTVNAQVGAVGALGKQVRALSARLDEDSSSTSSPTPPPPPPPPDNRIDDLIRRVTMLSATVADLDTAESDVDPEIERMLTARLDDLAATLATQSERIDAVAAQPDDRVSFDSDAEEALTQRLDDIAATLAAHTDLIDAPPAAGTPIDAQAEQALTERLDNLLGEVASLASTVEEFGQQRPTDGGHHDSGADDDLRARIEEISAALAAQTVRLDAADAHPHDQSSADVNEVATMRNEMSQIAERMATLDRRMTSVSMELANQLTELSSDLDVLLDANDSESADGTPGDDSGPSIDTVAITSALEAVQSSTERLAGEQARYQIQFREDLAELAERLRRPGR